MRTAQNLLDHIELTKKYVCAIQGELAQFEYLGGRRHKSLRHALARVKSAEVSGIRIDLDKSLQDLLEAQRDLDTYITSQQVQAARTTIQHLESYFQKRKTSAAYPPRFCIKLQNSEGIYTLHRSTSGGQRKLSSSISDLDVALSSNTGFQKVFETGDPYRENKIPEKAKTGEYKNPRLNPSAARNYEEKFMSQIKRFFIQDPDLEWMRNWVDADNVNARDCYKSTLIVPMTLLGQNLDPEFKANYGNIIVGNANFNGLEKKKFSYGFLCADCHEQDFFKDYDETYCFVFADLFSLFLIQGYSLREYSLKFLQATTMLQKHNLL